MHVALGELRKRRTLGCGASQVAGVSSCCVEPCAFEWGMALALEASYCAFVQRERPFKLLKRRCMGGDGDAMPKRMAKQATVAHWRRDRCGRRHVFNDTAQRLASKCARPDMSPLKVKLRTNALEWPKELLWHMCDQLWRHPLCHSCFRCARGCL